MHLVCSAQSGVVLVLVDLVAAAADCQLRQLPPAGPREVVRQPLNVHCAGGGRGQQGSEGRAGSGGCAASGAQLGAWKRKQAHAAQQQQLLPPPAAASAAVLARSLAHAKGRGGAPLVARSLAHGNENKRMQQQQQTAAQAAAGGSAAPRAAARRPRSIPAGHPHAPSAMWTPTPAQHSPCVTSNVTRGRPRPPESIAASTVSSVQRLPGASRSSISTGSAAAMRICAGAAARSGPGSGSGTNTHARALHTHSTHPQTWPSPIHTTTTNTRSTPTPQSTLTLSTSSSSSSASLRRTPSASCTYRPTESLARAVE
jgi:hypothetical protein